MSVLHVLLFTLAYLSFCSGKPTDVEMTNNEFTTAKFNTYYPATTTKSVPTNCVLPFVEVAGGCFYVHETELSWEAAREFCLILGSTSGVKADLAVLSDCDQFAYLWQHLLLHSGSHTYYIGGSDLAQTGYYHWVTGDSMPMGQPFWYPGYPSSSSYNYCVAYEDDYGYLKNWDCSYAEMSVCQQF